MGLDIGVVKITYLDRPEQPIYDFLWSLAIDFDNNTWGYSWEGNAFIEISRQDMTTRAIEYLAIQGLSQANSDKLMAWVEALPWVDDAIMLHMNW